VGKTPLGANVLAMRSKGVNCHHSQQTKGVLKMSKQDMYSDGNRRYHAPHEGSQVVTLFRGANMTPLEQKQCPNNLDCQLL
jgi:hypothetical protein